jgi:hypothetical protein
VSDNESLTPGFELSPVFFWGVHSKRAYSKNAILLQITVTEPEMADGVAMMLSIAVPSSAAV